MCVVLLTNLSGDLAKVMPGVISNARCTNKTLRGIGGQSCEHENCVIMESVETTTLNPEMMSKLWLNVCPCGYKFVTGMYIG